MTLHAAKAEFPVDLLVGLEQGLLPIAYPKRSSCFGGRAASPCYVGITRAQLYLPVSDVWGFPQTRYLFPVSNRNT